MGIVCAYIQYHKNYIHQKRTNLNEFFLNRLKGENCENVKI